MPRSGLNRLNRLNINTHPLNLILLWSGCHNCNTIRGTRQNNQRKPAARLDSADLGCFSQHFYFALLCLSQLLRLSETSQKLKKNILLVSQCKHKENRSTSPIQSAKASCVHIKQTRTVCFEGCAVEKTGEMPARVRGNDAMDQWMKLAGCSYDSGAMWCQDFVMR